MFRIKFLAALASSVANTGPVAETYSTHYSTQCSIHYSIQYSTDYSKH